MLSPAGRFYVPKTRDHSDHGKLLAGSALLVARLALDAGDRVTPWQTTDNIPSGVWSGSDAMDRLRVAIENHQKATERQTTTTRWLNVVMTALTILMAVPTVVRIWGTACPVVVEYWPTVRSWCAW